MQARLDVSLFAVDYGPLAPTGTAQGSTVGYYQTGPVIGTLSPTGAAATGILTAAGHQLVAGQVVWFSSLTGGTGLSANTNYFIINPTTNTFQLSLTSGGAAINFTTDITASVMVTPYSTTTRTVFLGPQRGGEYWSIERITVQDDSTSHVPSASIYKTVINASALVDYTPAGTGDVNDLASPTFLTPGDRLIVVFEGADVPGPGQILRSTVYLGGAVNR